MTACPKCGFVYEDVAIDEIAPALAGLGATFRSALERADPVVARARPEPQVWSPLEYAGHVRDVLLAQRDRVVLARVEENPSFTRLYRDERVEMCGYDTFTLDEVLAQLEMAAALCAATFARLGPADWSRGVVYSWPEPAERDLAWLGRHTLHEGLHHLGDVRRLLGHAQHAAG